MAMNTASIGRYLVAVFICWWVIGFAVAGIAIATVGNASASMELWVVGLAAVVAFPVQARLPIFR